LGGAGTLKFVAQASDFLLELAHAGFPTRHEVDGALKFVGAVPDLGFEFGVEQAKLFLSLNANESGGALIGEGLEQVSVPALVPIGGVTYDGAQEDGTGSAPGEAPGAKAGRLGFRRPVKNQGMAML